MYRALFLGRTSPWRAAALKAILAEGWSCRADRSFDDPGDAAPEAVEQIVVDLLDGRALEDAIRACNVVVYAPEPRMELAPKARVAHAARIARVVCDASREIGVERVVLVSSAITLEPTPGSPLVDLERSGAYLPHSALDSFAEVLFAVERECMRYAADAMALSILHPGMPLEPGQEVFMPRGLGAKHVLNVIRPDAAGRAIAGAMRRAHPGRRYAIGGVNTTALELARALDRHGSRRSGGRPRTLAERRDAEWLERTPPLDSAAAVRDLGHRPSASLESVLGDS